VDSTAEGALPALVVEEFAELDAPEAIVESTRNLSAARVLV
jgi:hypothetical protein